MPTSRGAAMTGGFRRFTEGRLFGFRPLEFAAIGDLPLHTRGDADKPADVVKRGFPAALTPGTPPRIHPSNVFVPVRRPAK